MPPGPTSVAAAARRARGRPRGRRGGDHAEERVGGGGDGEARRAEIGQAHQGRHRRINRIIVKSPCRRGGAQRDHPGWEAPLGSFLSSPLPRSLLVRLQLGDRGAARRRPRRDRRHRPGRGAGRAVRRPRGVADRRAARRARAGAYSSRSRGFHRALWLGTAPTQDPTSTTRVRGGLYRLDLDSGQVTVFEDQLPRAPLHGRAHGQGAGGDLDGRGVRRRRDRACSPTRSRASAQATR